MNGFAKVRVLRPGSLLVRLRSSLCGTGESSRLCVLCVCVCVCVCVNARTFVYACVIEFHKEPEF